MTMTKYQYYYKRNLPHYQPPGATFFITFRLYGSLPFVVIQQLEELKNSEMSIFLEDEFFKKVSSELNDVELTKNQISVVKKLITKIANAIGNAIVVTPSPIFVAKSSLLNAITKIYA